MEKVSAIITTHNREGLLKRAIESVLNQTYKNLECIVVDDNSTDNTREVCNQFPVNYIYIPKEETRGGNYARNLGIKAASGDYCAFLLIMETREYFELSSGANYANYNQINFFKNHVSGNARKIGGTFIWWVTF